MVAKKTNKLSSDGRSQKKRPSAAGKKVAQGSRLTTLSSSASGTGTPRLDRSALKSSGFNKASKLSGQDKVPDYKVPDSQHKANEWSDSADEAKAVPSEQQSKADEAQGVSRRKPIKEKSAKRKGLSRRFLVGSLIVVLLLAIGTGLLAWNQWFRYDDAADIQGTWVIEGTTQSITITDSDIVMTADVSYPYTLDTFQKTISFSFKQYSGSGSYAFSPERTALVITETDADSGEKVSTKLVKQ